ncbi:MAG: ATP-dependent Clp protease proteolytic subunit [Alistipes sp.]|nr:ATP-dependent Clp protease proteolytic subunit [Alistipes sp.]
MEKEEKEEKKQDQIEKTGEVDVKAANGKNRIHVMTIIGEIEGHDNLSANNKTTKYEHVLPKLASIQEDDECDGLLLIINTVGGDVSAGLALAEMVASLTKPKVSLVIGDCHSIGVPLAVSCDYSFIVPSGTMIIHPVRMNGTVIGAPQTYDYFKLIQDRIIGFISTHSGTSKDRLEKMMIKAGILTKDLGTILVGKDAVNEGLIDAVGGISDAFLKLNELIKS